MLQLLGEGVKGLYQTSDHFKLLFGVSLEMFLECNRISFSVLGLDSLQQIESLLAESFWLLQHDRWLLCVRARSRVLLLSIRTQAVGVDGACQRGASEMRKHKSRARDVPDTASGCGSFVQRASQGTRVPRGVCRKRRIVGVAGAHKAASDVLVPGNEALSPVIRGQS